MKILFSLTLIFLVGVSTVFGDACNSTSLLIHSDTFDGNTDFIDSSIYDHTLSPSGGVTHSTTVKKFGVSSIHLETNEWIDLPDSEAFDFGTGKFTIDFWVYLTSAPGVGSPARVISFGSQGSNDLITIGIGQRTGGIPNNDGGMVLTTFFGQWADYGSDEMGTLPLNTWMHFALVRDSGALYFFKDGQLYGTKPCAVDLNPNSGGAVGRSNQYQGTQGFINGYIDELRVVKGIAQWTAPFTVPAAPYTPCCVDGGDFDQDGDVDEDDLVAKQQDIAAQIQALNDELTTWINNCWSVNNVCQ